MCISHSIPTIGLADSTMWCPPVVLVGLPTRLLIILASLIKHRYRSDWHQLSHKSSHTSHSIPIFFGEKTRLNHHFPMVFQWFSPFSYGCPMVFLWFSYGFHHFPMVFPVVKRGSGLQARLIGDDVTMSQHDQLLALKQAVFPRLFC